MLNQDPTETSSVQFDNESGELRIDNYTLSDPDVAEFFEDRDEETLESFDDAALRVGVLALGIADTARQVDYVQRHFERLQTDFQIGLDENLGDNGRVERLLI